jgi:hypothetical protein
MASRHVLPLVLLAFGARAPVALAGGPSQISNLAPHAIRLVGASAGAPDSVAGGFTVTALSLALNPIQNSMIVLDFSGCPDLRLASSPVATGVTIDCARHTAMAITDQHGVAHFTLVGSGTATSGDDRTACVRLTMDGITLPPPVVSAFDLDGANGVGPGDLALWLADQGSHRYHSRADYDGDGAVTITDLALLLAEIGKRRSSVSASGCP